MNSLVVPVYRNEESIPDLLEALDEIEAASPEALEVVFVIDGSPDGSAAFLREHLAGRRFSSRLIELSRNFGSFAAVRVGLSEASGGRIAVMAADLQEPPSLINDFFAALSRGDVDVVVGQREARSDPALSAWGSRIFWALYRRLIQPDIPPGGVDVFACTRAVRDELIALQEANGSLVGLLFWTGYRRLAIPYRRLERRHGQSAWTLRKRLRYLSDSIYAFSDLPIRILLITGAMGLVVSLILGGIVLVSRISGGLEVPGYAAVIVSIMFFAALNLIGLGILGSYVWRTFENTKRRPGAIVMTSARFDSRDEGSD